MVNNLTKIKITSNNPNNIINKLIANNIQIVNLQKLNVKEFSCFVNDVDLKKLKKLKNQNCDLNIEKTGGIVKLKSTLINRSGLILGFVLSIIAMFFLNNRLLNIEISGLNSISKIEIEQSISEYGLKFLSKLEFNDVELVDFLMDKHDLALVSIGKKGNTLLINVKENETKGINYNEIISPYNMVIKKINIFSGSTYLKEGDVVYKGDILIYPYDVVNNEKVFVNPCGNIEADIFIGEKYIFKSEEKVMIRNGKSKVINIEYLLGKLNLFANKYENKYLTYETEQVDTYISKDFLPLKIKKTIAFELEEKTITRDFETEKEKIVSELKEQLYKEMDKTLIVDDEIVEVSEIENGYIINLYVKSTVSLNYKD